MTLENIFYWTFWSALIVIYLIAVEYMFPLPFRAW